MQRLLLATMCAFAVLCLIVGAWWYIDRSSVGSQLASYRIGQAQSFEQAKREIAAVEQQPNAEPALRELVSGWRTGNQSFDFYLATYLGDPQCSEALRRLFSLELAWRPELLGDWAHYWSWRCKQSPADEIAAISDYLAALSAADSVRQLTWREVLDVQAAFVLTGHDDLSRRLAPDNWAERYRAWRKAKPDLKQVPRPEKPLPDWQGPLPR